MTTKIFRNIGIICVASLITACSDEMDYHTWTNHDYAYITEAFDNVNNFVTRIYGTLDNGYAPYGNAMEASACDEAEYSIAGSTVENFFNGGWSATTPLSSTWTDSYAAIADCNVYLDDFADTLSFPELELDEMYDKNMYKYEKSTYEVRLLRAYHYFLLVRQYGDVPMTLHKQTPSEANSQTRQPAQDVMKFIVNECDTAAKYLPYDWATGSNMPESEPGRVNNLFALALKARTLLYAASPLFNTSNDQSLWLDAAQASRDLIEEATKDGLKLEKYSNIWDENNYSTSKEVIFARRLGASYTYEAANFPRGTESGSGGNCPSQTLVEAYDLKDGTTPDWSDPAAVVAQFDNFDPRFAMTIAVNGETGWPGYMTDSLEIYEGGKHGLPQAGATPTGYYLKKLLNGSVDFSSSSPKTKLHNWVIFRLGEFYLDYAEAAFRATGSPTAIPEGCTMSAIDAINTLRNRTGVKMPAWDTTLTNDEFWSKYERERMVELAFEGHRFYDVRRWKEGSKLATVLEMHITRNADDTFSYQRQSVSRQWNDKMYFFPISQSERMKNPNLTQNPGWE